MKVDYTCSDESWAAAGGVWCHQCGGLVPRSLFNAVKRCSVHGWSLEKREGIDMSGCNRGVLK